MKARLNGFKALVQFIPAIPFSLYCTVCNFEPGVPIRVVHHRYPIDEVKFLFDQNCKYEVPFYALGFSSLSDFFLLILEEQFIKILARLPL